MVIHTIISPEDIFYKEPERETLKADTFSTDPYYYLIKDMRKSVSDPALNRFSWKK